jgi:antitoxin (DNA-binding transcriptional repressor) of toxin-antitoxin stability system
MSIKELHRSLKIVPDIIESGEEILVLKNSAPAFKISAVRNSV